MIVGIQVLGMLFGLGVMYVTFMNYKRKELDKLETLIWEVIWISFILIVMFPSSLDFILKPLAIVRLLDLMTIVGFMFLSGITFHNYLVVKKNNKKMETLVRKLAK